MAVRYIQGVPYGARRLGVRKKLTWFRIAQVFGFAHGYSDSSKTGFQIWKDWQLDVQEVNDPLYRYHCAHSALARTKAFACHEQLDDLAARLSIKPRRQREEEIAALRATAYREKHRPRHMVSSKLTAAQREEAIQRCLSGESAASVAKALGVSAAYIWQLKFRRVGYMKAPTSSERP